MTTVIIKHLSYIFKQPCAGFTIKALVTANPGRIDLNTCSKCCDLT